MSFLRNFMLWNQGTEVAENYFFLAGISSLASCVNGRIWIRQGKFVHYPNLYIVLLGPPANGKTVAIDRAEEVVRAIDDTMQISGQSETAEGLVRFMREKCIQSVLINGELVPYTPLTLFLSELSNFFGKDPAGMVDFLTGVWDRGGRQFHRRTKGQGEDMLPRPNVNLLAGTTPAWITQYLKADIVGGGFSRRVIYANEPIRDPAKRVAWPEDSPESLIAKQDCIAYGKSLLTLHGEVGYTPEALAAYIQWYNTRPPPQTEEESGYHGSKPALMLKIAMLHAIAREPKLLIGKDDVEFSLALLTKSEHNRQKVFQAIGRNELNTIAQKVIGWIESFPEVEFKKSDGTVAKTRFIELKKLKGLIFREADGQEGDQILAHLVQTDRIFYLNLPIPGSELQKTFVGLKV